MAARVPALICRNMPFEGSPFRGVALSGARQEARPFERPLRRAEADLSNDDLINGDTRAAGGNGMGIDEGLPEAFSTRW